MSVRRSTSDDVNLANKYTTPYGHSNSNDWEIYPRKVKTVGVYMLSGKDVPPEQTSERRAEGCAESTIVDTECHTVKKRLAGDALGGSFRYFQLLLGKG